MNQQKGLIPYYLTANKRLVAILFRLKKAKFQGCDTIDGELYFAFAPREICEEQLSNAIADGYDPMYDAVQDELREEREHEGQ